MQGKILEYFSYITPDGKRKQRLTLELDNDFRGQYDELKDKLLEIILKPFRKKRSRDANNYFWVLADKLSAKIRIPKEDIYRSYIKDIGDNCEVLPIRNDALERFCYNWEHEHGKKRLGWMTERFPSKLDGYTNVIAYYGSSTYDTAQMSRLIEFIVQDCKENGIETMTPDEEARLMSLWESDYAKHRGNEDDESYSA